jgi:hypothetical protein
MPLRPQIYCCIIGTSTSCFTRNSWIHFRISSAEIEGFTIVKWGLKWNTWKQNNVLSECAFHVINRNNAERTFYHTSFTLIKENTRKLMTSTCSVNIFLRQRIHILIIGFCILLRVILTVNNTFFFATIDKVFYYVAFVLTTYRSYIIKYFVNCCEKEGIIYSEYTSDNTNVGFLL